LTGGKNSMRRGWRLLRIAHLSSLPYSSFWPSNFALSPRGRRLRERGPQVKLGWLQKLSLRGDGCQLDAQCRDLLKQIKALGSWREHASRFQ
jgi:hypothetical protein